MKRIAKRLTLIPTVLRPLLVLAAYPAAKRSLITQR